ncbi:hypothetical protein FC81_GL000856 [Liquorilactobacillus capillatus DSM 19910]|uniref:CheW-like domain-containing protein n=1 Tax=Liquorilactobacillus capillatus DSM 19910 TaxID=1423731 RepID=A0A0R1M227_9LACO|nr:hypothetical protein FC81_GL000856 [Liquorilactobacillus capillatus DSM 19910]
MFESHEQLFAMPVKAVTRVIEASNFITLPEVADYILGVYEYQEHMIPIIDLRRKLFGQYTESSDDNKVILCDWKDSSLGIFVENIIGISYLEETNYEQELGRANLKRGYIDKFLKLDDKVVISIELNYLFDNRQESELLATVDQLNADKGNTSDGTDSE